MPEALTHRAIALAHEGHQGIVKTKQLIRSKVWFPNMDASVEKAVKSCMACVANVPQHHKPPITSTELPSAPWTSIACDFYDAPNGQHLVVIVDEYSRYPIVEATKNLSAQAIIPILDRTFAMFGIPETLKSDNGPPFQSDEFAAFAETLGFVHHRVTPRWPRANGQAENFMSNLGKIIRAAITEKKPWMNELSTFLRNYRATPHCTTGVAPATALFGRSIRTKLPGLATNNFTVPESIRARDEKKKKQAKENADRRQRRLPPLMKPGDKVLVRQERKTKFTPIYCPTPYTITSMNGTQITARSAHGHVITRNISFFIAAPAMPPPATQQQAPEPTANNERPLRHRRPPVKLNL
jgi:hypothetical protein